MTGDRHRPAHRRRRPLRPRWTVGLAVVLASAGVLCVALSSSTSPRVEAATPAPTTVTTVPTAVPPVVPSVIRRHGATRRSVVPPAPPVGVVIPRIGVTADVVHLGLQADGTVEVPSDPAQVGWYENGPVPGAVGSSVLLGHVDSVDGPAVFAGLAGLVEGDLVSVTLADGHVRRFRVRGVHTYLNADFPSLRVYGPSRHRDLAIVTCGGAYDADEGGYQANVVVYTRRVTDPPLRATSVGAPGEV